MEQRLNQVRIYNMKDLLATEPKQMRKLWRSVTGERLWYALYGYDVMAQKSERGMFGHGRVLPPELRNFKNARDCSRLLLVKAARRMRREGFSANSFETVETRTVGGFVKSRYGVLATNLISTNTMSKVSLSPGRNLFHFIVRGKM